MCNIFLTILWILLAIAVIKIILIRIIFKREIKAIFDRDPAARNSIEVIVTYAGLHALIAHRVANTLLRLKVPLFPRLISQIARHFTGIEIHPGATIGNDFFIDHGMGVVIGETTIIGDNVTLFQGVTLGGTGKEQGKRHPTIGKNVVVGTGAKILGNIIIGDNSYVGANAVVIRDVPPNSTVVGVPGRITKQDGKRMDASFDHKRIFDPITQAIEALQKRIEELEKK
ncbi:serine O-acetyltransferase EpsC [Candidatus Omnitrophota bacterium]